MDYSAPVKGLYVGTVATNGNCQIFLLQFQMTFKFGITYGSLNAILHMTFEILTVVSINCTVFLNVLPRSLVENY